MPLTDKEREFVETLFRDNYKILSKRVYGLLQSVDPASTEDCLSNIFLTLCLCAEKVISHENPSAWLFLTAKHICLKHIRQVANASKRSLPLDENIASSLVNEQDMEEALVDDILYSQWENDGMITKLLEELNSNEREIIKLRFEQGLSNREIGKLLGKSEDAVRFTIYYARKKISEKIYNL